MGVLSPRSSGARPAGPLTPQNNKEQQLTVRNGIRRNGSALQLQPLRLSKGI